MSDPVVAIVVAAGSGSRLGSSDVGGGGPKALRRVAGVPLVTRSVLSLVAGGARRICVVIPAGTADAFAAALADCPVPVTLVAGGLTRQESVRSGLTQLADLPSETIVLVHDAARCLVPVAVVRAVVEAVRSGAPAVTPVVPLADSVRQIRPDGGSDAVDRASLRAVQTPQGFRLDVLRRAHQLTDAALFTDDVTVCEASGYLVTLVAGDRRAMKITEPADFAVAEQLLQADAEPQIRGV